MARELPKDQESAAPVPGVGVAPEPTKGRKAISGARRVLTDQELESPAARIMLLDEVERLESEIAELSQYRSRFHEADRECSVLKERERGNLALINQRSQGELVSDILSTGTITLGGVVLGLLHSLTSSTTGRDYYSTAASIGVVLMLIGIVAKVIRFRR